MVVVSPLTPTEQQHYRVDKAVAAVEQKLLLLGQLFPAENLEARSVPGAQSLSHIADEVRAHGHHLHALISAMEKGEA